MWLAFRVATRFREPSSLILEQLRHARPDSLHRWAGRVAPALGWAAVALIGAGLAVGLLFAPADSGQGDIFRVVVLYRPAAMLSVGIYAAIGILSVATLRYHARLAAMMAGALAPTGVLFTLLALWTDALWRRPVQGAWWAWEAESVSQLLLLFLYGGYLGLRAMIDDPRRAESAGALLAVLGAANLPVLYFSLHWWDALRRGPVAVAQPYMTPYLFLAAVMVGAGFAAYAAFAALKRVRCLIAERDALARSVRRTMESAA